MRGGILVTILAGLLLVGCSDPEPTAVEREPAEVVEQEPATVTVVYEVEGTDYYGEPYQGAPFEPNSNPGSFDLTAETPTGTTQQSADMPLINKAGTLGLRYEFRRGSFVYIAAQTEEPGDITCRIIVDGKVISEVTSSGQYSIATCEGTA